VKKDQDLLRKKKDELWVSQPNGTRRFIRMNVCYPRARAPPSAVFKRPRIGPIPDLRRCTDQCPTAARSRTYPGETLSRSAREGEWCDVATTQTWRNNSKGTGKPDVADCGARCYREQCDTAGGADTPLFPIKRDGKSTRDVL